MKIAIFFLYFCISYLVINAINFYQVKHIEPTIWNLTKYNLILLPVLLAVNILVTMTFSKAFSAVGKMWPITIMSWGSTVLTTVILAMMFFKEFPKGNVIIGLVLTLTGILIANYK